MNILPQCHDLVLIGGGHAHALVLRRLGMNPVAGLRLTLITPEPMAAYSGMLPGHVAGHYAQADLEIDLIRLARFAQARVILARATGIDRAARAVRVEERAPIAYDTLSIDVGITAQMPALRGFAEHGLPVKPLEDFATGWQHFCETAPANPRVVILGGGIAGVELALACAHRLGTIGKTAAITLVDRGAILSDFAPMGRAKLRAELARAQVTVMEQATPQEVLADQVVLEDGRKIAADLVIGAASARAHPWLAETGLAHHNGFLRVGPTLQSLSDPRIFAAGDCAHLDHAPRPKAGVYAVRAGAILAHNLAAIAMGRPLRPYHPQKTYLKLVSLGAKRALAEKGGFAVQLPLIWRWKDRIDRAFMAKLADLPQMPVPALPRRAAQGLSRVLGAQPPCGGCGAKLAQPILTAALPFGQAGAGMAALDGDDAAILAINGQDHVLTTDHLRGFCLDPAVMAEIAAIHALGDIWAMGAKPQSALAQITLPQLSPELQARSLSEIMEAARGVFAREGVAIIGGHSTSGAELSIGFSLTGALERAPCRLSGAQAGDVLILTKPIGSGVLLAAEMTYRAQGRDIAHLWQSLRQSQAQAAAILTPVAHAMTDVTGFGLAGHALNIARASRLGVALVLDHVPLYHGALCLARGGLHATLTPSNRAAIADALVIEDGIGDDAALLNLLFDPQTAGGLLAAIPPRAAQRVLPALREAGYAAAEIGEMQDGPAVLTIARAP